MSVELLQTLSLISFIIAGVLLVIAAMLFFLLDIPKIVGDITGSNERKAIENIRQHNEDISDTGYKPDVTRKERRMITDKISRSGRLDTADKGEVAFFGTKKFATEELAPSAGETTVLSTNTEETTVLSINAGETTVLDQNEILNEQPTVLNNNVSFTVDVEMSFTGSAEVIE